MFGLLKPKPTVLLSIDADYWLYTGGQRKHILNQRIYVTGKDEEDALDKLKKYVKKVDGDRLSYTVVGRVLVPELTDAREIFLP